MTSAAAGARPLPMQTRPRPGETIESFVHRLARTNHLRPSYLRRLVLDRADHPYGGSIGLARLAALTGRTTTALERAFTPPAPPDHTRPTSPQTASDRRLHKQVEKPALFAAIRDAADSDDLSIRALASRFRVHRRTIRQALASPTPPARKQPTRPSHVLHGLHGHIDEILHADPDIPAGHLWESLIDDHGATVSYSTVRDHLTRQRNQLGQD